MRDKEDLISTDLTINHHACVQFKKVALWGKIISTLALLYSVIIALGGVAACIKIYRLSNTNVTNSREVLLKQHLQVSSIYQWHVLYFFYRFSCLNFQKICLVLLPIIISSNWLYSTKNLKIFFRFTGMLAIILLVLTLFAIIGILITVSKN